MFFLNLVLIKYYFILCNLLSNISGIINYVWNVLKYTLFKTFI